MSVLVLGASGLAGSALTRLLESQRRFFLAPNSRELNLRSVESVRQYFRKHEFETVFFAAARVGGVGANIKFPMEFLAENIEMEFNFLNIALENRIPRVIFLSSSCVYPVSAPLPYTETSLFKGDLSESVRPYAIAKIAGMEFIRLANMRHGLPWISVIPSNLYGIQDNFKLDESHVLAASIRKIWEAQRLNANEVEMWGNPKNERDFLFSDDLARALLFLETHYFGEEPINVGPGVGTSISQLLREISQVLDFSGRFVWNSNMPSGVSRKVLDNTRMRELGFKEYIPLNQGIAQVIRWLDGEKADNFRSIRWH